MKNSPTFLVLMLCASSVLAEPPTGTQRAASALVEQQLVKPLTKAESRRRAFSRMVTVPVQRRVRVLDPVFQTDARGKRFMRFAIDERRRRGKHAAWQEGTWRGCVYPEESKVFVERGDQYVPARSALGGGGKAQPGACQATPPQGQLAVR